MTSIFIAAASFLLALWAGTRSLKAGVLAVMTVGYLYGITRANIPDIYTYLMFDLAAIGLYASQLWRPMSYQQRIGSQDLRIWVAVLIGWPILLFVLFPTNTPLVELVGLRANVFFLPFLLLGSKLTSDDLSDMSLYVAGLNLAAVGVATAEYYMGIAPFFPKNEVTDIIYKSHDLLEMTAFRIPSTFSSAHAFAGTMAVTLPLLIGAWSLERGREHRWKAIVLSAAVIGSFLGIFMAAARIHMITATLLALAVTFSGQLSGKQWVRWVAALCVVGYVVAGNQRLQRFTTLTDKAGVSERIVGSVNEDFLDTVTRNPLGRGLAGGGTSVPYFLRSPDISNALIENEYARIALEEGLPGLAIWVLFILWIMTRGAGRYRDEWWLTRRLGWVVCASIFVSGMLGMGMLASVPQTSIMLMTVGWMTTSRRTAMADVKLARMQAAATAAR